MLRARWSTHGILVVGTNAGLIQPGRRHVGLVVRTDVDRSREWHQSDLDRIRLGAGGRQAKERVGQVLGSCLQRRNLGTGHRSGIVEHHGNLERAHGERGGRKHVEVDRVEPDDAEEIGRNVQIGRGGDRRLHDAGAQSRWIELMADIAQIETIGFRLYLSVGQQADLLAGGQNRGVERALDDGALIEGAGVVDNRACRRDEAARPQSRTSAKRCRGTNAGTL